MTVRVSEQCSVEAARIQ